MGQLPSYQTVSEGKDELAANWLAGVISKTLTVVDGLNREIVIGGYPV
jgi:hypothetical protein